MNNDQSCKRSSDDAVEKCRLHLCESLKILLDKTNPDERAIILSGGVDTCAILEAAALMEISFAVAITVVIGDDAPDEAFSKFAASKHNIEHCIIRLTAEDLVERYLPQTVKLLHTWDGMTLRNSLVISAAFQEAKRRGMSHVIVGDGADELFGGYSFMWGCEDDVSLWKKKRDDMCNKWTFATSQLADSYGIKEYAPYMEEQFVSWALENTTREDCIGERPIKLVLKGESIMHAVGKVLLREAFETCASWRRKDPIEVGSGATIISGDDYWADKLTDEEFRIEQEELKEKEGLIIRSKEHLINLRSYMDVFGGLFHPKKKRMPIGQGCAGCCFEVGQENFCHICGAWPAQRKKLSAEGGEDDK